MSLDCPQRRAWRRRRPESGILYRAVQEYRWPSFLEADEAEAPRPSSRTGWSSGPTSWRRGCIPGWTPPSARGYAREIREAAARYRKALDPARGRRARVELLDRVRTAHGHAAQIEPANLKRVYKADGTMQADVHSIIPDRPRGAPQPPKSPISA